MKQRLIYILLAVWIYTGTTVILYAGDKNLPTDVEIKPVKVYTVPYALAVLDKVIVIDKAGKETAYQVAQDGQLDLGDGGSLKAKGLSTGEVAGLVRKHLGNVDTVRFEEFRANRISILGEVFHQIFTEMSEGPMRVMDGVAAANGFTPLANTRRVKLVRENAGRVEVYELDLRKVLLGENPNENLLMKPGDVITVPRNFL